MWTIWDKKIDINGCSAEKILDSFSHLRNEETIFIKIVNDRVTQVEGKSILANVYGIDATLPDEEFIAEYERIIENPADEPDGDSATYEELVEIYKEGVNNLDE